jgi:hypothetical protein
MFIERCKQRRQLWVELERARTAIAPFDDGIETMHYGGVRRSEEDDAVSGQTPTGKDHHGEKQIEPAIAELADSDCA